MNKMTRTSVIVSENTMERLKMVSIAVGKTQQEIFREAFEFYLEANENKVRAGYEIAEKQKKLREE